MDFEKDVLKIFNIICKNITLKDEILNYTKKELLNFQKNKESFIKIEKLMNINMYKDFLDNIIYQGLCGIYLAEYSGKRELVGKRFFRFLESFPISLDFIRCKNDILKLDYLLKIHNIDISLKSIVHNKNNLQKSINLLIYELEKWGYKLCYIELFGYSPNIFIVSSKDFNTIQTIKQNNYILKNILILGVLSYETIQEYFINRLSNFYIKSFQILNGYIINYDYHYNNYNEDYYFNNFVRNNVKEFLNFWAKNKYITNFNIDLEKFIWTNIINVALCGEIENIDEKFKNCNFNFPKGYKERCSVVNIPYNADLSEIYKLQHLININELNFNIKDMNFENDCNLEKALLQLYNKIKSLKYILAYIDLGNNIYSFCILKEQDFNKVRNIIKKDSLLKNTLTIEHFYKYWKKKNKC